MALTCSREFIKYLFYALDLLNLLFSIVLLAHTIVVLIQIRHMEEVRKIGLFVLMLSCLLSVVMSIVGFCGAKREVKYMLYTFAMYIFIALLIQGTLSVMEIVKMPGLMDHMLLDMKEKWHDRAKQSHYWDIMQKDGQCCGLDDPTDWPADAMPDTCCREDKCTLDNAWKKGCHSLIDDYYGPKFGKVIILAIINVVNQMVLLALTCILIINIWGAKMPWNVI